ncbi:hypothetical protein DB354_11340 [Opitutus sp. ER46]|nr:hypothetical protein DB354_11340 [Opitutus sp. ER46]
MLLASALVGAVIDWRVTAMQSREIARTEARVATLRRAVAVATTRVAGQQAAERAAEDRWDVVAAQMAIDERYGPAPAKIWRARIKGLQDAMARTPGMQVPELAHLQLKDWVEAAVRAAETSPADMGRVLAALRYLARLRVAEKIQDALARYVATPGNTWPTDMRELIPLLPGNVTAEMLASYRLTNAAQEGAVPHQAIEGTFGAISIRLTPGGWSANAKLRPDTSDDAYALFGGLGTDRLHGLLEAQQQQVLGSAQRLMPMLEGLFSEKQFEEIGPQVRAAVQQYIAANAGRAPRSMADIRALLPASSTIADALRPVLAQLEYAMEHGGEAPADPRRLKRYVEALDDARVLRRLRLTPEPDGGVTMNFDFGS